MPDWIWAQKGSAIIVPRQRREKIGIGRKWDYRTHRVCNRMPGRTSRDGRSKLSEKRELDINLPHPCGVTGSSYEWVGIFFGGERANWITHFGQLWDFIRLRLEQEAS